MFGFAVLSLVACSSNNKSASTEVENELKVSCVSGVAATGYAMSNAPWEVVTSSGVRIAQGTTDAYGKFSAQLDTVVPAEDLPWLVRVYADGDSLSGFVDAIDSTSDSLFGLVNPISDFVVRRLLGPASNNPFAGYQPPGKQVRDSVGQATVNGVIGSGFDWSEFNSDRSYRPALKSYVNGYVPSASDMIVHSLGGEANRLGITRTHLLDTLFQDTGFVAMNEKGFRLDVAANMALFGIPPDSAKPKLESWQKSQGIEDGAADAYYMQMWDYGHGSKDTTGMGGPQDPLTMSMQAANMAMQRTSQTYADPEWTDALNNFNPGMVIISDLVYPLAANGMPAQRVQQIADNVGMVLSALRPIVWSTDSLAVKSLAKDILDSFILVQPDSVRIQADTLRYEVFVRWKAVSDPAFKENPLRTTLPQKPVMQ